MCHPTLPTNPSHTGGSRAARDLVVGSRSSSIPQFAGIVYDLNLEAVRLTACLSGPIHCNKRRDYFKPPRARSGQRWDVSSSALMSCNRQKDATPTPPPPTLRASQELFAISSNDAVHRWRQILHGGASFPRLVLRLLHDRILVNISGSLRGEMRAAALLESAPICLSGNNALRHVARRASEGGGGG